jgi:predicted Zn-dependent protease
MAAMFRTMQSGGPEWLSDHPNPGNRSAYITQEARTLRVAQHRSDGEFQQIQRRLGVRRR